MFSFFFSFLKEVYKIQLLLTEYQNTYPTQATDFCHVDYQLRCSIYMLLNLL